MLTNNIRTDKFNVAGNKPIVKHNDSLDTLRESIEQLVEKHSIRQESEEFEVFLKLVSSIEVDGKILWERTEENLPENPEEKWEKEVQARFEEAKKAFLSFDGVKFTPIQQRNSLSHLYRFNRELARRAGDFVNANYKFRGKERNFIFAYPADPSALIKLKREGLVFTYELFSKSIGLNVNINFYELSPTRQLKKVPKIANNPEQEAFCEIKVVAELDLSHFAENELIEARYALTVTSKLFPDFCYCGPSWAPEIQQLENDKELKKGFIIDLFKKTCVHLGANIEEILLSNDPFIQLSYILQFFTDALKIGLLRGGNDYFQEVPADFKRLMRGALDQSQNVDFDFLQIAEYELKNIFGIIEENELKEILEIVNGNAISDIRENAFFIGKNLAEYLEGNYITDKETLACFVGYICIAIDLIRSALAKVVENKKLKIEPAKIKTIPAMKEVSIHFKMYLSNVIKNKEKNNPFKDQLIDPQFLLRLKKPAIKENKKNQDMNDEEEIKEESAFNFTYARLDKLEHFKMIADIGVGKAIGSVASNKIANSEDIDKIIGCLGSIFFLFKQNLKSILLKNRIVDIFNQSEDSCQALERILKKIEVTIEETLKFLKNNDKKNNSKEEIEIEKSPLVKSDRLESFILQLKELKELVADFLKNYKDCREEAFIEKLRNISTNIKKLTSNFTKSFQLKSKSEEQQINFISEWNSFINTIGKQDEELNWERRESEKEYAIGIPHFLEQSEAIIKEILKEYDIDLKDDLDKLVGSTLSTYESFDLWKTIEEEFKSIFLELEEAQFVNFFTNFDKVEQKIVGSASFLNEFPDQNYPDAPSIYKIIEIIKSALSMAENERNIRRVGNQSIIKVNKLENISEIFKDHLSLEALKAKHSLFKEQLINREIFLKIKNFSNKPESTEEEKVAMIVGPNLPFYTQKSKISGEKVAALLRRHPLVVGLNQGPALGLSVRQFLRLFPDAESVVQPYSPLLNMPGAMIGGLIGWYDILNPNEKPGKLKIAWKVGTNGCVMFIFTLGSAIGFYLYRHPNADYVSNETFFGQIFPGPFILSTLCAGWNFISATKGEWFPPSSRLGYVKTGLDVASRTLLYSGIIDISLLNLFRAPGGFYELIPLIPAALISLGTLTRHKEKFDTTMVYLTSINFTFLLVQELVNAINQNNGSKEAKIYLGLSAGQIAFWLVSLLFWSYFVARNSTTFIRKYQGEFTTKIVPKLEAYQSGHPAMSLKDLKSFKETGSLLVTEETGLLEDEKEGLFWQYADQFEKGRENSEEIVRKKGFQGEKSYGTSENSKKEIEEDQKGKKGTFVIPAFRRRNDSNLSGWPGFSSGDFEKKGTRRTGSNS